MDWIADVDAVVLDAGGVLLLPDPARVRSGLAPYGAEPDDEACFRAHYDGVRALDELGRPDWRVVDDVVARSLGVAEQHLEAVAPVLEEIYSRLEWVPIAGVAEALRALQEEGVALAVVSNASGTMEEQLETHEICSVAGGPSANVAIVVDSHHVGVEKPDPAIFRFALDALALPPERCLYVGDTIFFDVVGARTAGLLPVHLDPYALCPDDSHAHLAHVRDLLPEWRASRAG